MRFFGPKVEWIDDGVRLRYETDDLSFLLMKLRKEHTGYRYKISVKSNKYDIYMNQEYIEGNIDPDAYVKKNIRRFKELQKEMDRCDLLEPALFLYLNRGARIPLSWVIKESTKSKHQDPLLFAWRSCRFTPAMLYLVDALGANEKAGIEEYYTWHLAGFNMLRYPVYDSDKILMGKSGADYIRSHLPSITLADIR